MSPNNINNNLSSYQKVTEHEALYLGDMDETDNPDVKHNKNTDKMQIFSNGNGSDGRDPERSKFQSLLFLAIILSLAIGWSASKTSMSGNSGPMIQNSKSDISYADDDVVDTGKGIIPNVIWSDEFDGDELDLDKWTFVNGNGCDVGLCGWGNNELEWYTPSNVKISNGKLIIEARKFVTPGSEHPVTYTSSKLISRGKADFGVVAPHRNGREQDNCQDEWYGCIGDGAQLLETSRRFEARIRLPWGRGIWPAFWMLPTDDTYGGWPQSGEIDIMENIGKEGPNTVHGTVHYGLSWPQHQYSESGITLTSPSSPTDAYLNETFHTYAVERLPGEIRWFIDDIEYSSITKQDMEPYHWPFDEEFYFIMNLAVGGSWPGNPVDEEHKAEDGFEEATVFPQKLEFDYVRVYEGIFPRIIGETIVDCLAKDVVYEITNVEDFRSLDDDGVSFTWTVPDGATITKGQGTSRVHVDFASVVNEDNINDSEVIRVQASGLENHQISNSIGLTKLHETGIGLRVKVVDFDGKCSSPGINSTALSTFDFDCGRPSTCNQFVLHRTTEEYTCGERIQWLIEAMGMDEMDACEEVGFVQFHGHCGPCNPMD